MDALIALGAGASVVYGIYALYKIAFGLGHGDMATVSQFSHDLYFEGAGTILALITLGKFFEAPRQGSHLRCDQRAAGSAPQAGHRAA